MHTKTVLYVNAVASVCIVFEHKKLEIHTYAIERTTETGQADFGRYGGLRGRGLLLECIDRIKR